MEDDSFFSTIALLTAVCIAALIAVGGW